MSTLLETVNRRLFAPTTVFGGGRFRHPCHANCGNTMIVPDPESPGAPERLEEGHIWACAKCGANHEYYLAYAQGARAACVRLLLGEHVRESGEPDIAEFVE